VVYLKMVLCCCFWGKEPGEMNESLVKHSGDEGNSTQRFAESNAAWDSKQRVLNMRATRITKKQGPIVSVGYELWRSRCKLQKARHWDDSAKDNFSSTSLADILQRHRRILITGFPGCFVGNCTRYHIPTYYRELDSLKIAGVDQVVCISVNDPYTQHGWLQSLNLKNLNVPEISVYADPDGELVSELGMGVRLGLFSLGGIRSRRFALIVTSGVVQYVFIEDSPDEFEKTKPFNIIAALENEDNPLANPIPQQRLAYAQMGTSIENRDINSSVISIG